MDGALPIVVLVSLGVLINLLLEGSLSAVFFRRLRKPTLRRQRLDAAVTNTVKPVERLSWTEPRRRLHTEGTR